MAKKKKSMTRAIAESDAKFDLITQDIQRGNDSEEFGPVRAAKALAAEVIKLNETLGEISMSLQALEDLSLDIDSLRSEISTLQVSVGFLVAEMAGNTKSTKATKKKSSSKKKS